jgi:hypothetical protein
MITKQEDFIRKLIREELEKHYLYTHYKQGNFDVYYFDSDNYEYKVKFHEFEGRDGYYSVGFGVRVNEYDDFDTSVVVNDNAYKTMETIAKISFDFLDKHSAKGFIFSFTGDKEKNRQRLLLYKRFIDKKYSNSILEFIEGIYYLTFN